MTPFIIHSKLAAPIHTDKRASGHGPTDDAAPLMYTQGLIDNPLTGTTLVATVNVIATYVALKLMDSCGRRTLVLWRYVRCAFMFAFVDT